MAKTIAYAYGLDASRTKSAHRLGSRAAETRAATWRTFATVHMRADGSGWFQLMRDGHVIDPTTLGTGKWGPE